MGVIKDGSISGVLPSNKVFAINYPGYPSSIERALVTLGGTQGIAKARESPSNNLELHFRPEDPYSHPITGEVMPCNHFLLKLSKHNIKEDERQISEVPEDQICADIVGMADYQHVLAVHADVARKKKRNWADMEPQFGSVLMLKPSMYASLKKRQEGVVQHRWEFKTSSASFVCVILLNIYILIMNFAALTFIHVPKKVNWEKFIPKGTEEWKCQMAVCDLFDECPIWIRQSLSEHLFLFRAAYYFANGPFHRFWIRKGYDPRKDPESRIYQRIDFRVPPSLRSYCDSGIASGLKHKWEDLCGFQVFPYKCQTSFQLSELVDDYIQQEIKKPSTQKSCNLATGWFPPHILDIFRFRLAVRFLAVYPNPGAESFLKSASIRFEKSKRTINAIKEKTVNKDEVQIEKEMSNDEDDEMEDDIEDENADDDFNPYEGLDMMYLQELFGSFPNNGGRSNELLDAENSDGEYHIFDGSNSEDDDEDY
ncbi:hypothetical protein L1987_38006 [Smallanthus sonchifolius]|uniref:Uncharacterized protein n=1 Tax=Smallanthus sonchifolius TaxID=185202 RepID=A0ACB9HHG9_9ASTR|nr:hypothetical protein L1987_38006 [Smallanthus sonchifolius]